MFEFQSATNRVNRSTFRYRNQPEIKMIKKKFVLFILVSLLGFALQVWSLQARAVDYELPDVNGQIQALDQYQGKWVIVNYWATWCDTCMKELPDLASFHQNNKNKDAVVVGINFEEIGMEELHDFIEEESITFTVLSSKPVPITPLGPVPALPTTYIIDPEGKVVAGDVGIITQQNIEDYIASKKAASTVAEETTTHDDAS